MNRAQATRIVVHGREAQLVCHMAVYSGRRRRNSFAAIRECLEAGAGRIEIDVHSLDGPDYIVFHDRRLAPLTTGEGPIGKASPEQVRAVRFADYPDDRPALLSEIVDMARSFDSELQLDLKDWRPMVPARLRTLSDTIAPIKERVIVSCGQDWNLRLLHRSDPDLAYGFDPGHYFDHAVEGQGVFLPRAMGAYGYRDDHPLAFGRTEPVCDYLHERMEMLIGQVPGAREFFLSYRLVSQMLDDGFNVCSWLHERGIDANVWTPDFHGAETLRSIERLVDAGVDRITTNTAPEFVREFAPPARLTA
jgi:glycerophosphoryl diester phosphodiesterase